jgi:hypothetical protein
VNAGCSSGAAVSECLWSLNASKVEVATNSAWSVRHKYHSTCRAPASKVIGKGIFSNIWQGIGSS